MIRYGFTLIELLVVLIIIGILSSIVLATTTGVRETVEDKQARHRLEFVRQQIQQSRQASDLGIDKILALNRPDQKVYTWQSIRSILIKAAKRYGAGDPSDEVVRDYYPPGMTTFLSPDAQMYVKTEKSEPIGFRFSDLSESDRFEKDLRQLEKTTERYVRFIQRRKKNWKDYSYPADIVDSTDNSEVSLSSRWFIGSIQGSVEEFYEEIHLYNDDMRGEDHIRTRDCYPLELSSDQPLPLTAEFLIVWPTLSQRYEGEEGVDPSEAEHGPISLFAWPESDWKDEDPYAGELPIPIYEVPFGQYMYNRLNGQQTTQFLERRDAVEGSILPNRTLIDFSPLFTYDLLKMFEILPARDTDRDYATNRSESVNWNDPWGNPIVLAISAFVAPRYDFEPLREDTDQREVVDQLHGDRNWLQKVSRDLYGANRSISLTIGGVGPERVLYDGNAYPEKYVEWELDYPEYEGSEPLEWSYATSEETRNPSLMRALWAQLAKANKADEYDDQAFADEDDWNNGLRTTVDDVSGERCYLLAPIELR